METLFDLKNIRTDLSQGSAVTIGNFDGMHLGHQRLIARLKEKADAAGLPAVLITFDPHPLDVLPGKKAPPQLTTLPQRLAQFERCGVDLAVILPFTPELAALSAEAFCRDVLIARLGMKELVIGHDFTLGKARAGNATLLAGLGMRLGFGVEQLPPVTINGAPVSSTRLRRLVAEGQVADIPALMGRAYAVAGTVVHGAKRGSTLLGFPTANIEPDPVLLPAGGVYAVAALLPESAPSACAGPYPLAGVANVGTNPTFDGKALSLEVHLLDFSQDIYGYPACVAFFARLRDERKFNGPDDLIRQIRQDIEQARSLTPPA